MDMPSGRTTISTVTTHKITHQSETSETTVEVSVFSLLDNLTSVFII